MLKKHSQLFVFLLMLCDTLITFFAWIGAYFLRKTGWLVPMTSDLPDLLVYLKLWPIVLVTTLITFFVFGLYHPKRDRYLLEEFFQIFCYNLIVLLILSTFLLYYARDYYSRLVLLVFLGFNILGTFGVRISIRYPLRYLRKKGFNLRTAIIVGSGRIGQKTVETIQKNSWTGIRILGYFDPREKRTGRIFAGLPVLGTLSQLPSFLEKQTVDQAYIALPLNQNREIEEILDLLAEETLDVRIVPDTLSFMTMHHMISNLDDLPIISLTESPLYGWRRLFKRLFDIVFSLIVLILISPLMLLIAILIKWTSSGPVFYYQQRMGLDGKLFYIIKFRSMRPDAEKETGAIWSPKGDTRVTWIGKVLRKTSLDEFPQFWNVFKGEMSVVGPRPERPELIQHFKKEHRHRRYMHRHKMKAGITGLAQIYGWRGDGHPRALVKRLQYDLKYIREWSLWLDFKIIFKTPWALMKGEHPQFMAPANK
ncbi:MAG: undecaprenyl-phosphate glucose phosphotransferase [Planctomycetota bacterium]